MLFSALIVQSSVFADLKCKRGYAFKTSIQTEEFETTDPTCAEDEVCMRVEVDEMVGGSSK